jgi:hypothetical protein
MRNSSTETLAGPVGTATQTNGFHFVATDVTNTHLVDATDLDRNTPAFAVANALAAQMDLPQGTPWALREDSTGTYLDDNRAIGEQIAEGSRLTLTPKTHLG